MGRNAATAVEVGELQARAEFEEGVPAEDGGDERAVGFQGRGDLGEERGEIVDPVEGEGREDGIEGSGGEGEGLRVRVRDHGARVGG